MLASAVCFMTPSVVPSTAVAMMCCVHAQCVRCWQGRSEGARASLSRIPHGVRQAGDAVELLEFASGSKMPPWSMLGCRQICIITMK